MPCMVVIAVLHISIKSLHLKCCLFINSRTHTLFEDMNIYEMHMGAAP